MGFAGRQKKDKSWNLDDLIIPHYFTVSNKTMNILFIHQSPRRSIILFIRIS